MFVKASLKSALLGSVVLASGMIGYAQDADSSDEEARELDKVVVVGSQIVGSDIAGALPVTVLSVDDIDVTGAASGDELLRAIPQVGDIIFSEAEFTGVNGARGDIGSINLRGIGTGNTLVLLNGRRLVLHPGTQVEDLVPVNPSTHDAIVFTRRIHPDVLLNTVPAIVLQSWKASGIPEPVVAVLALHVGVVAIESHRSQSILSAFA